MMSNLSNQSGFYQNVTRKITSFLHNFFTIANLVNFFSRNQYLRYVFTKVSISHFCFKSFLNLSFFSTYGTKYVPFLFNPRHLPNCLN